jgi:hypothetical protein
LACLCGSPSKAVEGNLQRREVFFTICRIRDIASLQEGFDCLIAEANAGGCSVDSSNRSLVTEVERCGAIYIDPEEAPSAADSIATALAERERWRVAGFQNAVRFSRAVMVAGYVQCYRAAGQLVRNATEKTETNS